MRRPGDLRPILRTRGGGAATNRTISAMAEALGLALLRHLEGGTRVDAGPRGSEIGTRTAVQDVVRGACVQVVRAVPTDELASEERVDQLVGARPPVETGRF